MEFKQIFDSCLDELLVIKNKNLQFCKLETYNISWEEFRKNIIIRAISFVKRTFTDFYNFFAFHRNEYDKANSDNENCDFGQRRDPSNSMNETISVITEDDIDDFMGLIDHSDNNSCAINLGKEEDKEYKELDEYDYSEIDRDDCGRSVFKKIIYQHCDSIISKTDKGKLLQSVIINGFKINLTEIIISTIKISSPKWSYLWALVDRESFIRTKYNEPLFIGIITHPQPRFLPLLENNCNKIFKVALDSDDPIKYIAELHWMSANAIFVKRGNAAISEFISISLLFINNISFDEWLCKVDMCAFKVSVDEFINSYPNLFI